MAIKREIEIDVKTGAAVKNVESLNKEINKTANQSEGLKGAFSGATSLIDKASGGMISKFQNVTKTIGGVSKGFGSLRGAIIATGIGALVVLVGSLIEYFSNFEAGVRIVSQVMNTLAGTINAIVSNATKLLTLDFKGFFKGVAEGATDAWQNTNKLFEAQEKLFELNKKFTLENAQLNAEIEKQARIVRDTTLGYEERLAAQKELDRLSEILIENERELNQAELERLQTELLLENNYEKRRDLELQIQKTMAGLIESESRLAAQRDKAARAERQIIEEQQKQREEERKKRQDAAQKLAEQRQAEQKALLTIEANFRKQLEDLEDKTEEQKLERAKARQLADIEQMKGTEEDKQKARLQIIEFYAQREIEIEAKKTEQAEKLETDRLTKIEAIRAEFDFKRRELEVVTEEDKLNLELEKVEKERLAKEAELIALGVDADARFEILQSFEMRKSQMLQSFRDLEIERERALLDAKLGLANQGLSLLSEIAGRGSKIGKSIAIAQTIVSGIQGVQNAFTTAQKSPITAFFPAYPILQAGLAGAFSAVQLAKIKSTNPTGAGGAGGAASVSSAVGGSAPAPPQFNIAGGNVANQLSEVLTNQQPVQAYVVGSQVTSQQALDRNIINNASLG